VTPEKADADSLFAIFKRYLLSPKEVIDRALNEVVASKGLDRGFVKSHFSKLVVDTQDRAYSVFLDSQRAAWSKAIEAYLAKELGENPTRAEVIRFLSDRFDKLDSFFLSLGNSRRPRAGIAFEIGISDLFKRLDYPFVEQPLIDGQPDFLLPDTQHFRENPVDCIIFTVKRTLRERWRQIVTEGTRGLGFFLATIDESISGAQLGEMSKNRIFLVVPEPLKRNVVSYTKAVNVITFESFFENYLDPALKRWTKGGIV
jgi:hypothetical protein